MDTSAPADATPVPREAVVDTIAAQAAAIDEIIALGRHRVQIFDIDLSQAGWQSAERATALSDFVRSNRDARVEMILHDTRFLESSCARLSAILRLHSDAITVYRTGPEARGAMDPLVIVDGRHFLHRFHIDRPRAALAVEHPQLARPLVLRFEQIWATGEPGWSATVLGL